MNKKIKIGVDIDDTVCILAPAIDKAIKKKYNVEINKNIYNLDGRYSKDGINISIINDIIYNDVDWGNLRPVNDAVKYIKKLQDCGVELYFITHRAANWTPDVTNTTALWLNKYFTNYKVIYAVDKMGICKQNHISYMIDNNHEVFTELSAGTFPIFYTGATPTTNGKVNFQKFKTWKSIYKFIRRHHS